MSLTLPVYVLSSVQLSIKIRLPDGAVAVDMVNAASEPLSAHGPPEDGSGRKFNMSFVTESSGVSLALWISGDSESRSHDELMYTDSQPLPPIGQAYNFLQNSDTRLDQPPGDYLDLASLYHGAALPEIPFLDAALLTVPSSYIEICDLPHDFSISEDLFHDFLATPATAHLPAQESPGNQTLPTPASPSDRCTRIPSASASPSPHPLPPNSPAAPRALHTKPKRSFPCTLGCARQFSRTHDRFRHEVGQHERECEWVCTRCMRFFSKEASLRNHACKKKKDMSP
ncbi:hypothetical protein B0H15DRAFT_328449 [Mycena belliarum]|uniref:C2H2-type domain-containing protein n=1 Tax=Mycena belliarum TaxID=1033014 RepID=A0AAD6UJD5_9AGAR|nr:hypothetical protein B0H15DRAFT_328449 [Mycena belliae]